MRQPGRPRAVTDTCDCCRQTSTDFTYAGSRNPSGRKLTICLCRFCQALFHRCRKCKCVVKRVLLDGGICPACRTSPDRPVRDIDERIDILARRPMTWEQKPSFWDRWRAPKNTW